MNQSRFAIPVGMTNRVGLDLSTIVANCLQQLLDFSQKT